MKLEGNKIIGRKGLMGTIVNGVYVTLRNEEHRFRKFDGWGISEEVLDILEHLNVEDVLLNYSNKHAFKTNTSNFLVHGIEYNDNEDKQLILSQNYWEEIEAIPFVQTTI